MPVDAVVPVAAVVPVCAVVPVKCLAQIGIFYIYRKTSAVSTID